MCVHNTDMDLYPFTYKCALYGLESGFFFFFWGGGGVWVKDYGSMGMGVYVYACRVVGILVTGWGRGPGGVERAKKSVRGSAVVRIRPPTSREPGATDERQRGSWSLVQVPGLVGWIDWVPGMGLLLAGRAWAAGP